MRWNAGTDVLIHLGRFDLGAEAFIGGGSADETESKINDDSGVQTAPFRLEDWYLRQMEYNTVSRTDAGLSLRYNFRKGIYLQAEGHWTHGFGLKHLIGPDRFSTAIRIGYNF